MLSIASVASPALAAGRQVQLGRADDVALDQPRVYWEFRDTNGDLVGPGFDLGGGVLDTGANGILVGNLGYFTEDLDFDPNLYPHAQRPDGSIVQYEEIGVAGTAFFDVFKPNTFAFTTDGVDTYEINNVTGFGSMDVDLGSFNAVIGMPAMRGRVVNINTASISTDLFISTTVGDTPAPATPHSYRVRLDMLPAEHTPPVEPGDPTPTFADLPLVRDVTTANGGRTSTNTILLDTGAQFSMISTATANALGINLNEASPDTDVLDHLEVGGIGGSIAVPLVLLDRMVIPTEGGTDLVLTDLLVGVIDIPTIGGIFGMNLLTSGQSSELLGGTGEPGYFDSVELDFRDPTTGTMTLNVNPAFDVARRTLTWAGAGAATNWVDALPTAPFTDANGVRQAFVARDYVRFTDAAAVTNVNVSAAVNPDWVFVENTAKTYTFAGAGRITGNARLTKTGTGHLRIQTANDYTGPTDIAGGSVAFAARQDIGTVDVRAGASATFETSQRFAGLDVGGTATLTPHGSASLKAVSLVGAGLKVTGRLDLTDNALAVRPIEELEQSREEVLEQVTALIVAGRDGGGATKWTGNGLVSSSAAANPSTTLGVATNDRGNGSVRFASLGGESLTADDVIVRWTFAGDADLDGAVSITDFSLLASNYGQTEKTWATGDFNLDGAVGIADFSMLASNFGKTLPGSALNITDADWAALEAFGTTVPEPTAATLLLFAAAPIAGRRRRR